MHQIFNMLVPTLCSCAVHTSWLKQNRSKLTFRFLHYGSVSCNFNRSRCHRPTSKYSGLALAALPAKKAIGPRPMPTSTFWRNFSSKLIREGCIYVHWPYCRQRCSYCNFVKFAPQSGTFWTFSNEIIEDGLVRELKNCLENSSMDSVISVFFGGGTPSLANPSLIKNVLSVIKTNSSLSENVEVTLEVNPTLLQTKKLLQFQSAGVNRLSIGAQSLDPDLLKILNRDHSMSEAVKCILKAKEIFPEKVSVDMMFALPYQTCDMLKLSLEAMLKICDNHLSLYQLTLEKGTDLYKKVKSGWYVLPDEESKAEMYEMAISLLKDYGFYRYEISNFAKNLMAESIHNKAIWQGSQFIGIGPGAHSRVFKNVLGNHEKVPDNVFRKGFIREAKRNVADPASWLAEIKAKGNGIRLCEKQSTLDVLLEYLATSLRTKDGLSHHRWIEICNIPLTEFITPSDINVDYIYMQENGDLRATPKGLNVLDSLLPNLINIIKDKSVLLRDVQ